MEKITKTPAELIDELVIVNLKIWYYMEKEIDESLSVEERFQAGQTVLALNKKRSRLKKGLDLLFGYEDIDPKTY